MKDLRIEKLANNLLNHSINLQKGEKILIEIIGMDAIPLGKELIKQSESIGALPFFNIIDHEIIREMQKNATEEQIEKVVAMAHLDEFAHTLENGLDTFVGERGTTLSGGQRQRVAIARAMLKDAPIVILDEATSALDNKSEAIVQKALDNLIQNKTVFVIAHRLSTIKNADRIAVINEGELAELGTHDELMNIENGKYKYLYEMQFKSQETTEV